MKYKKSAHTKQLIYDTTVELFHKMGYRKTTIRDIAAKSGLNSALLYYYFPDGKLEIARRVFDAFRQKVIHAFHEKYTIEDTFVQFLLIERVVFRECLIDEQNLSFFIQIPKIAKSFDEQTRNEAIRHISTFDFPVNKSRINTALIIYDGILINLYREMNAGAHITFAQICEAADICAWEYLGVEKDFLKMKLEEAEKLFNEIPEFNIPIFEEKNNFKILTGE